MHSVSFQLRRRHVTAWVPNYESSCEAKGVFGSIRILSAFLISSGKVFPHEKPLHNIFTEFFSVRSFLLLPSYCIQYWTIWGNLWGHVDNVVCESSKWVGYGEQNIFVALPNGNAFCLFSFTIGRSPLEFSTNWDFYWEPQWFATRDGMEWIF